MKDIKIIVAKDQDMEKWNKFVTTYSNSNVYQLYFWKKIIQDTYLHTGYYLMAINNMNNMELLGILPIVKIDAYKVIKKFTSIPFVDLGGVLAKNKEIETMLIDYALNLGVKEKISAICLRQERELSFKDNMFYEKYPHFFIKKHKVRLILKLSETSQELFKSFKSKLRSQIRKPIKEGLNVKKGNLELIEDFYNVFVHNMKFLGSPVHSINMIKNTLKYFSSNSKIFVVYKDNFPIASSLILEFKDMVYNPWASSLREFSKLSPNMLLYWSMLEYACDKGYRYFDFGRSTPGEGTYRFKKQWGAEEKPLYWYIWSKRSIKKELNNNSQLRSLIIKLWSKLPVGLTIMFGPKVRRYIDL